MHMSDALVSATVSAVAGVSDAALIGIAVRKVSKDGASSLGEHTVPLMLSLIHILSWAMPATRTLPPTFPLA